MSALQTQVVSPLPKAPGEVSGVPEPEVGRAPKRKIAVGDKHGRMEILACLGKINSKSTCNYYLIRCVCGTEKPIKSGHWGNPKIISCGCYNREKQLTHGRSSKTNPDPTYGSWLEMRRRTLREAHPRYARYGERGIDICAGWLDDFAQFLADMGERPPDKSVERIENEWGYWCGHCNECIANNQPANCIWDTPENQANNRSTSHWVDIGGVVKTIAQWAKHFEVPYSYFRGQLDKDERRNANKKTRKRSTDSRRTWGPARTVSV